MKDVSLFIPCTVDLFLPHIGEATVDLLRRVGANPVYHRGQTCCGQPAMNFLSINPTHYEGGKKWFP